MGCAPDPGGITPIYNKCKQQNQPSPSLPPGFWTGPGGGAWCSLDLDEVAAGLDDVSLATPATEMGTFSLLMGGVYDPQQYASDQMSRASTLAKPFVYAMAWAQGYALRLMGAILNGVAVGDQCATVPGYVLKAWRIMVGFGERWLSTSFGDFLTSATYYDHYLCPHKIPSTADAQAAYLANAINDELLDAWTAANDDCTVPARTVLEARRSKLQVGDIVSLYRRGFLSQGDFEERIRELGYINTEDPIDIYNLSQQIPPVSELIRMMVRDVADQNLVNQFGMDTDFTNKWTGQLQEWGYAQGITDEYAQYEWRAHWSIPSPTQLYEMYHRFRNLQPGDPLYTDEQTVRTALEQQDILPYWIDRLLGVSLRLKPRSDLIQMTHFGVLNDQQLNDSFSQLGYSDADRDLYVTYLKRQHKLQARTHPYTRLYLRGEISQSELRTRLDLDYYSATEINDTVTYCQVIFTQRQNAQCRDGLRRQYFLGQVDENFLQGALPGLGYDIDETQQYISTWKCVRASKYKHASALKLCGMAKQGVITLADMALSLTRIGYDPVDVARLVASCQKQINDALKKAQERQQKQQQKAAQQAAKKAAQLAAKLARQAAQAAKQANSLQKQATAVQKAILKAAEKWSRGCGGAIEDNVGQIVTAVDWIEQNTDLEGLEILDAVIEAATQMDGKASCDWTEVYQSTAVAWVEAKNLVPGPLDTVAVQTVAGR